MDTVTQVRSASRSGETLKERTLFHSGGSSRIERHHRFRGMRIETGPSYLVERMVYERVP